MKTTNELEGCEVYVFTGVCLSMRGGGVCPIACWDIHTPLGRHPPGQTPPSGQTPPGRHPPGQTPLTDTLLGRHPPGQTPSCPVHAGIHPLPPTHTPHWNAFLFHQTFCLIAIRCFSSDSMKFNVYVHNLVLTDRHMK